MQLDNFKYLIFVVSYYSQCSTLNTNRSERNVFIFFSGG